jgi:DNA-binding transcriptional MerR regulator
VTAARPARSSASAAEREPAVAGPAGTAQTEGTAGSWPRGLSRSATMRISDVLAALRLEFPAVSTSKLRFLEEQGLVDPVRTPSGYRQYSPADLERLRFVLREQRDRYVPLKVIGERLAALDAGSEQEPLQAARLVPDRDAAATRYTTAALAREAAVDEQLVLDLVQAGVLRPSASGHLDPWAKDVVTAAAALAEHGIGARHLRTVRSAADRQIDMVEAVVAPWRGQPTAEARGRAGVVAAEVGELCTRLHTALVRGGVADLTP